LRFAQGVATSTDETQTQGASPHLPDQFSENEIMFEINRQDESTVSLAGRLDAAAAPRARKVFDGIETTCRLDLTGLDYIASVGLGLLASAQKRLMGNGDGLILVGLNPHLREVLSLAGFEGIFEFE
jgi:anti-anti-sigma factor